MLSKTTCNGPFHVSNDVLTFCVWAITPSNFVRIFCHLLRMCVGRFILPHFMFFPLKRVVCSVHVHFSAAVIIRRSVFSTLRVTFSRFHIISIAFRPVINAVIITYIIRQYNCTNTLRIQCISGVRAIHNGRQKLTPQ